MANTATKEKRKRRNRSDVRRRRKSEKRRNRDSAGKKTAAAGKALSRAKSEKSKKTGAKSRSSKPKRDKQLSVSIVHSPPGIDGGAARPLNPLLETKGNDGLGCKHCKFYQFSCPDPEDDLKDWKGKKEPTIEHECQTWGVNPRGGSEKDRSKWGQIILKFKKAPKTCDVLFVGEAPGEWEDEKGFAFVGRSGRLLHEVLYADTKIGANFSTRFTNVVRCWPWKTPTGKQKGPTVAEMKHCAGFLTTEIERTKPKIIVTLGATALKAILGKQKASIRKLDGHLQKIKVGERTVWVLPVYHPAHILRNDHLTAEYIKRFRALQSYLKELKKSGKPERRQKKKQRYEICRDFSRAIRVIANFRKSKKKFAYDIEAKVNYKRNNGESAPSPYVRGAKIALVGLCNTPGRAFCIPYRHREVKWTKQQRKKVKKALKGLLTDPDIPKVAQNKKFDNSCFKVLWNIDLPWDVDDTMSDHYTVDETQGTHSLDHLAHGYVKDLAGYKEDIEALEKKYNYDFTRIPLDEGGEYNCKDVDVTLQVEAKLEKAIQKDPKLWRLAKHFLRRGIPTLGRLEHNGVMVDLDAAEVLRTKYTGQLERIEKELRGLPEIQKYQSLRRRRVIKERKYGPKAPKTWKSRVGKLPKGDLIKVPVNFNSPDQVAEILYKQFGYKITKKTDKGKPSTDKEMLIRFATKKNCRFSKLIMEFRLLDKIVSTYIDSIVHDVLQMRDGMLHGSYSLTGPVTGRTSSSAPNLQNFPNKGNGDVKRLFISRFGSPYNPKVIRLLTSAIAGKIDWDDAIDDLYDVGVILDYDYSQIELRILAIFSQDPVLLKIYQEGGDVHLETTLAIFNMTKREWDKLDKDEKKRRRTIAKRVNFGCVPTKNSEALTPQGWKRHDEINVGDLVMGYENGKMTWTPVRRKVVAKNEPVMRMANDRWRVTSTPDHRWKTSRRVRYKTGTKTDETYTITSSVDGEDNIILSAPANFVDKSGLSPEEAGLIALILGDGHFKASPLNGSRSQAGGRRRKITLSAFQSIKANPNKCSKIGSLFTSFDHSKYTTRADGIIEWRLRADAARALWAKFDFENDSLEDLVLSMGPEQRRSFIDYFVLAEGSLNGNNVTVGQNEGPVLDAVKLAFFLDGKCFGESDNGEYKGKMNKRLTIWNRSHVTGQKLEKSFAGFEDVWCVQTDCNTWVMRQNGRMMITGNTVYGSGAAGIVDILAKEDPPIYITKDKAQQFIDRLFRKYKGVRRWIDRVLSKLHQDEQLRTVMGRLRRLREIGSSSSANQSRAERQGPNALIQSAASDVTMTSLILLVELFERMAEAQGLESKVILTVHDSIVFDVKFGELQQVASIIEEIMTNIPKYGGMIWGEDFDWEWLERIPIITDGEIGPNYRDKYEYGTLDPDDPFKVHKAFATALLGDGKPKDDQSRYVGSVERDEKDRIAAYGDVA